MIDLFLKKHNLNLTRGPNWYLEFLILCIYTERIILQNSHLIGMCIKNKHKLKKLLILRKIKNLVESQVRFVRCSQNLFFLIDIQKHLEMNLEKFTCLFLYRNKKFTIFSYFLLK